MPAAFISSRSPSSSRICTSRPTRPKKVRKAASVSSKASSPASRPASSTGFSRSPMAKRPLASTIAAEIVSWPTPACATATRLSAIDVSVEITLSQLAAKLFQAFAQRCGVQLLRGHNCRRALSTPASAPWPSAARRGRRTICRAFPWSSSPAVPRRSW